MDGAHSHKVGAGTPERKFCGGRAGRLKPRAPWTGRPQTDGEQGPVSLWADLGKDWDRQDRENPGTQAWHRVAEVRQDLRERGRGRETPQSPRTSDQRQPHTPRTAPTPHTPRASINPTHPQDQHQPHKTPGPAPTAHTPRISTNPTDPQGQRPASSPRLEALSQLQEEEQRAAHGQAPLRKPGGQDITPPRARTRPCPGSRTHVTGCTRTHA